MKSQTRKLACYGGPQHDKIVEIPVGVDSVDFPCFNDCGPPSNGRLHVHRYVVTTTPIEGRQILIPEK